MTDATEYPVKNGWVLYDASCRMCVGLAMRFRALLARGGFEIEALQAEWVRKKLGRGAGEPLKEMKVLAENGNIFGGAAALMRIAHAFWWARPLTWLAALPGAMPLLDRAYQGVAARRHCANASCETPPNANRWVNLMPLAGLSFLLCLGAWSEAGPAWVRMWLLAGTVFYLFKWMSLRRMLTVRARMNRSRLLAYLFAWPGMDAENFFEKRTKAQVPLANEWIKAVTWTLIGSGILWGLLPWMVTNTNASAWVLGWTGMLGLILALHFGSFLVLALFWRSRGLPVRPLMRAPLFSNALSEFWGERWNSAFTKTVHQGLFKPLYRKIGIFGATLAVFGFSGLVHDLVISVPAAGGYGLPSIYFLIQGLGLLAERTAAGRSLGMGAGVCGRIWTLLIVALPVGALFHPPFVLNVMLPFFKAIGAA